MADDFNPAEFLASNPAPEAAPPQQMAQTPAPDTSGFDSQQFLDEQNENELQEKHGGTGSQIGAFAEGALQGTIGPLAPLVEHAFGAENENILGRAKANPWAHGAGEVAGLVGGALTGTGEAALAEKAGVAGAEALGLGALEHGPQLPGVAAKFISKGNGIASTAARAAIENGFIQSSDETAKMFLGDPDQSLQTAVADIGLSGLIGGGVGAAIGGTGALWHASGAGGKLGQFIEDFKGQIKNRAENPDPLASVTEEFTNLHNNVKGIADEVYGAQGIKAQDIAKSMPEMSPKIVEQEAQIGTKLEDGLNKLKKAEDPHAKLLAGELEKYQSIITNPEASVGDRFNARQELKQQLQEWGKFNKDLVPLNERPFRNMAKELSHDLRMSLEDSSVWGKAGERQQAINKAFTEYSPALKDFESKFTSKVAGEKVIDPGKIQTYMNQLGKSSSVLKQGMVKDFLDASERYLNVIDKSHANLGLSPIDRTSVSAIRDTLKELTHGAKLANYVVDKGAANLAGSSLGAGIGGAVGHGLGAGGIGALVGEHALGPFLSKVLPSLVRPILDTASNSAGLKAAVDYGVTALKGENLIGKATKNVFKAGREVLPQSLMPTEKDTAKLDKHVSSLRLDPLPLEKVGHDVAHYMPNHGTAAAQTATNAINYLNTIRPSTDRKSPLDSKPVVNPVEKAQYQRALGIAQQPVIVLDRLAKGTITVQDVMALKSMYPSLYTKFTNQLTQNMTEHTAKGGTIPYKTRLGMSVFMGQPLDSTMQPMSIIAAQPHPAANQGPQDAPQGKPPAASSMKGLSKLPQQYMTPNQSRQAARNNKD